MIDHETRSLFAESVHRVYERGAGGPVDADLDTVGWRDSLPEWGGTAIAVVFGEQGRACGVSSAIDDVLAYGAGVEPGSAVVGPAVGATEPPGAVGDDRLSVRGLGTARLLGREHAVVVARDAADGERAITVPTELLTVGVVEGLDPDAGLVTVTADAVPASSWLESRAVDWTQIRAVGQVALAAELVGAARGMLELAREHALTRVQFGRPISSFQAVRHRLADAFLAIESADAAVAASCDTLSGDASGLTPAHAAMSKALAGRAARVAARHTQQVLAGIGFTAEHRFHHYLRRALVLDEQLGSARALTRQVGAWTLADSRVPIDLPL